MKPFYDRANLQVYHAHCCDVFDGVDLFPTSTIITGPPYIRAVYSEKTRDKQTEWTLEDEAHGYAKCVGFHGAWMQRAKALLERSSGRCWIVTSPEWMPSICRVGASLGWPMPEVWYSMPLQQVMILFGLGIPEREYRLIDMVFRACVTTPRIPFALVDAILGMSSDGPVLDPFCGDGSVLVAAKRAGLFAVGVDLKIEKCKATIAALEAE